MINKFIKLPLVLGTLLAFLAFTETKAAIFIPDLYISGGILSSTTSVSSVTALSTTTIESTKGNSEGLFFTLGLRPIDLPIVGGFRGDLQYYLDAYAQNVKRSSYGAVIYFDFLRILPINPYIGVGITNTNSNLKNISNRGYIGEDYERSKGGASAHIGVNLDIPFFPLDVFIEYRKVKKSLGAYFRGNSHNLSGANKYNASSDDILIGVKYYIIK
ncbi:hypothetical protein ABSA28_00293 [Candidatus Hepatincolaceae symbiont of Richtersius coronifer]